MSQPVTRYFKAKRTAKYCRRYPPSVYNPEIAMDTVGMSDIGKRLLQILQDHPEEWEAETDNLYHKPTRIILIHLGSTIALSVVGKKFDHSVLNEQDRAVLLPVVASRLLPKDSGDAVRRLLGLSLKGE